MPGRRRAREFAVQALYAVDIGGVTGANALSGLWAGRLDDTDKVEDPIGHEEMEFAQELVRGVTENREALDQRIEAASLNWRLPRMPAVDRNILRLGAHELISRPDIPASVSINEAIEVAKRFGGAESRAFVNGILDRIAADTGRGGRRPRRS
ncbi:MAG: transcription antitermination factor NusB [Pseudomonadota bacterium]|nr:transcription antitermination factor NusB [Pseudomonadota bacterium]